MRDMAAVSEVGAPVAAAAAGPAYRIERQRAWSLRELEELWAYRELLYFLVWRDIKVRYKQTALGVTWALLQPAATMVVFWVFFGKLAHVSSDGLPYPLFSLAGLIPWTYFSTALAGGSGALVNNRQLISKVYFPRLLVPLAAVLAPLVDLAVSFLLVAVLMVWFGAAPRAALIWLPVFLLLLMAAAAAASLWLATLQARYRDVRYLIPFLTQFWLFLTPVVYPSSLVPARWQALYGLNPLAGVISGVRWALLGGPLDARLVAASVVTIGVALAGGYLYFRRFERTLADIV
ncbi:MAG TPA: ABC transporter permease [Vicinamibacterales bacterium]|nr:ABC transporter permease [Vicinamibacterales bacterium]